MTTAARSHYSGYRSPAEIISHAVTAVLPVPTRMVEEMLAARGVIVSYETVGCGSDDLDRSQPRSCLQVRFVVTARDRATMRGY